MNQKRTNLCFDIDDYRQRRVYNYLQFMGRGQKTAAVVSAIESEVFGQGTASSQEKAQTAEISADVMAHFTQAIRDAGAKKEAEQILQGVGRIEGALKELKKLVEEIPKIASAHQAEQSSEESRRIDGNVPNADEEEMSEDAFAAVMSLFG